MDDSIARNEVETHTTHPRAVREILAKVRDQVITAFDASFFDGDGSVDTAPIVKVGITESGTVHISAQRIAPALEANVTLFLRSDFDALGNCCYHLHGRCEIAPTDAEPHVEREIAVPIETGADGALAIDVTALRTELAHTIRGFRR